MELRSTSVDKVLYENNMILLLSELRNEVHIVGIETLNIIDIVLQHGDSVDADTKGKAFVRLIIIAVES